MKVTRESISSETAVLTERGKGATVGELAVVGLSNIRTATVIAIDETECLALSKEKYESLIEKHPRTALKILKSVATSLCQRVQELSGQVADFL